MDFGKMALAFGLLCAAGAGSARTLPADAGFAKQILIRSVGFRTAKGQGQVPGLAAYYASILKDAGFAESDIEITPVGETATLAATLRGSDVGLKPILLLGHMDVVEAKAADWDRDPFVAVEQNGYLFGRGAQDNKYDVAMLVATLARFKREGIAPRRTIILLLSGDEETGMTTAGQLAAKYRDAWLVLNGDSGGGTLGEDGKPSYYTIQAGEKTYVNFSVAYTNPGGHSARPAKVNAIYQLAAALTRIADYSFPPQSNALTRAALNVAAAKVEPELGAAMRRFAADPDDVAAAERISESPDYLGQVRTTCVATMVAAGHAQNALPQRAEANVNCRLFPGVSVASVQAVLTKVIDDPAARIIVDGTPVASDASPLRPDVMKAITKAVHARFAGLSIVPAMSAGATDSVHFRAFGLPAYGVGTVFIKHSEMFAHGLNERVPVGDIKGSLDQWHGLLRDLAW